MFCNGLAADEGFDVPALTMMRIVLMCGLYLRTKRMIPIVLMCGLYVHAQIMIA